MLLLYCLTVLCVAKISHYLNTWCNKAAEQVTSLQLEKNCLGWGGWGVKELIIHHANRVKPCMLYNQDSRRDCISLLHFQWNGKGVVQSFSLFLYEIIHPTGGTQLANTQVALICSKCVILALVALFLGRTDSSHAVICTLLSSSLCSPWALSWRFDLEPVHLRLQWNMPNRTMHCYRAWQWIHVSYSDKPGFTVAPLVGIWPSMNLC